MTCLTVSLTTLTLVLPRISYLPCLTPSMVCYLPESLSLTCRRRSCRNLNNLGRRNSNLGISPPPFQFFLHKPSQAWWNRLRIVILLVDLYWKRILLCNTLYLLPEAKAFQILLDQFINVVAGILINKKW